MAMLETLLVAAHPQQAPVSVMLEEGVKTEPKVTALIPAVVEAAGVR
jgi:hypothetical protein